MRAAALVLAALTLGAAAVFTAAPELDLAASAPFYDPATGTWFASAPPYETIRQAIWNGLRLAVLAFAALFAAALFGLRVAGVPAREWGFALLAQALGPGLLVDVILKGHWGRARPRAIAEFGGEAGFTPALQVAQQCAANCSFVSGEVSGTTAVALSIWLIAGRRITGPARIAIAVALTGSVALTGWLRLAAGGHFLSDTVFAACFSALLSLALWRLVAAGVPGAAPRPK